MKIGFLSDSHDNVANLRAALARFRTRDVTILIHCGDVTHPKMLQSFHGWQVAFVFGNLDRDKPGLRRAVERTAGPHFIGPVYEAEVDGWRIGACHGHDEEMLLAMIESGAYDLVAHGHSHRRRDEQVGETRVINPGALGGRQSEGRSVCVFHLDQRRSEFVDVG